MLSDPVSVSMIKSSILILGSMIVNEPFEEDDDDIKIKIMPFDFFFFSHLFMTLIVEDRCYSKENSCKQNDVYFKLGKNRIQTQICHS